MQEIKKRRIVLASLLKPVDDTRMYEKLGLTLASVYEVYIIGQPTKEILRTDTIHFISLPSTHRLSFERLLAPWRVLRIILRIQPAMVIVCTAELLPIALCARLLRRLKIVYDVQENYAMNVLHGNAWPGLLRRDTDNPRDCAVIRHAGFAADTPVVIVGRSRHIHWPVAFIAIAQATAA